MPVVLGDAPRPQLDSSFNLLANSRGREIIAALGRWAQKQDAGRRKASLERLKLEEEVKGKPRRGKDKASLLLDNECE